jgi:galactoside O-acetyltransferase
MYLGKGAIVGKAVRIRKPQETIIGDYSIIDDFTYISCAAEIGRYCHIAPNVTISGGSGKLRMGDFCGVSAGCSIHIVSSDYLMASFELPSIPEEHRFGGVVGDITFEDHVLLGAHSVILPGVHLPQGFACGALTVIRSGRQYEPWTLYTGFDCKRAAVRHHGDLLEKACALTK